MKFKNNIKRGAILILALILASASSFAVYAAVNYNSANDPVVSFSGMVSYVNDILAGIRSSIKDLELRITLLEAGGFTPGASTGGMVNSGMLWIRLMLCHLPFSYRRGAGGEAHPGEGSRRDRFVRTCRSHPGSGYGIDDTNER